jgi:VanZ family protein
LALAVYFHDQKNAKKNIPWILIIGCLYALSDEFHQSFVPGRTSELGDIIADCLGICMAVLLYWKIIDKKSVQL